MGGSLVASILQVTGLASCSYSRCSGIWAPHFTAYCWTCTGLFIHSQAAWGTWQWIGSLASVVGLSGFVPQNSVPECVDCKFTWLTFQNWDFILHFETVRPPEICREDQKTLNTVFCVHACKWKNPWHTSPGPSRVEPRQITFPLYVCSTQACDVTYFVDFCGINAGWRILSSHRIMTRQGVRCVSPGGVRGVRSMSGCRRWSMEVHGPLVSRLAIWKGERWQKSWSRFSFILVAMDDIFICIYIYNTYSIYIYLLRLGTILIFLGSIQRWAQLLCLSWLLRTSTMTWRQGLSLVILVISIACDVSILMWLLDTSSHGSFQHLLHASPLLFDDVYYLSSANATNTHQWDKYQLNHEITQLLLIDFSANT